MKKINGRVQGSSVLVEAKTTSTLPSNNVNLYYLIVMRMNVPLWKLHKQLNLATVDPGRHVSTIKF